MKRNDLRILCALLSLILLLLSVAACGEPAGDPVESEIETVTETETEAESETETESEAETETETESETEPAVEGYNLFEYVVVRPENADTEIFDMAVSFLSSMANYAITMDIKDDWVASEAEKDNGEPELLLGKTNRVATATTLSEMPPEKDYAIRFFENKIVIVGRTIKAQKLAVSEFFKSYVKKAEDGVITGVDAGTVVYGIDPSINESLSMRGFSDFPKYLRSYDDATVCSYYVTQYLYKDVEPQGIEEYMGRLEAEDFLKAQDLAHGENRSITYTKGEGMVHLYYRESVKELTVSADTMPSDLYTKPQAGSWEVKNEKSSFAVMTMDYSKYSCGLGCNPIYDNNGLCYVVTLQDGRYIVYDGGYESPNDCEIIYEFLRDNNKREGKPVIAAWVFTHSHGDHYGAFISFTAKHAGDVVIENFVQNTGTSECYTDSHDITLESLGAYAKTYYDNAAVLQPHVGQRLYFCDVEIEVLYTHEMFHFNEERSLSGENVASMETRIWIDGVSILISGDAARSTNQDMVKLLGNYLKSDFLQVSHHGNGGFDEKLLRAADPTYILWTTSQPGFRRRTTGNTYSVGMPGSYDAKLNKKTFEWVGGTRENIDANGAENQWCADGDVEIMTFGPDKALHIEYYVIRDELLPNNVIEAWDAEFTADPRQ